MIHESKSHLQSVDETYFIHMIFALKMAALCMGAALCLVIHALLPACCTTKGSETISRLKQIIDSRKAGGTIGH